MDDDEELLELGARRRRPAAFRIGTVLILAAAIGAYVLVHDRPGNPRAAPSPAPSSAVRSPVPPPSTPLPSISVPRALPPWPQRDGACGSSAFLPLVSTQPLTRRTGVRAVVGDRLTSVDLDTGRVRPVRGLPRGQYASDLVTTGAGTYALLRPCAQTVGEPVQVVRMDAAGALHPVARGRFDYLLGGGAHPWAVGSDDMGERSWIDPLDGGPRRSLRPDFAPVGGFGDLVVGTVSRPGAGPDAPFTVRLLDPRTGRRTLALGPAASVSLSRGVVLWVAPHCTDCRLHQYDLATGRQTVTAHPVHRLATAWNGVLSPDHRTAAFVRQRARPARYDMQHPGNPNEVVLVDLVTGATRTVPTLTLWSKSFPGLDFSADSRWLLISLDEGSGLRLLLWRPGLARPLQSPARIASRVAYTPGLATLG